jgi:hypothetical protein
MSYLENLRKSAAQQPTQPLGYLDMLRKKAAEQSAAPPEASMSFKEIVRGRETGGHPNPARARNKLSSATGTYQIIKDTWNDLRKVDHTLPSWENMPNDPDGQERAMDLLTQRNTTALNHYLGRAPEQWELFMAHRFGAPRASELLNIEDAMLVEDALPARVMKANPDLKKFKTVGELKQNFIEPFAPVEEIAPEETTEEEGMQYESIFSKMKGLFSSEPKPEPVTKPISEFPTREQGRAAIDSGEDYGTGNELYTRGILSRPLSGDDNDINALMARIKNQKPEEMPDNEFKREISEGLAAAQIAMKDFPLAKLGYDPRKISFDPRKDLNIVGIYSPKNDSVFASTKRASTIVHESIHRGVKIMRDEGLLDDLEKPIDGQAEEFLVRWLMHKYMGNPEAGSGAMADSQINMAGMEYDRNNEHSRTRRRDLELILHRAEKLWEGRPQIDLQDFMKDPGSSTPSKPKPPPKKGK